MERLRGYRIHQSINALIRLYKSTSLEDAEKQGGRVLECWQTGRLLDKDIKEAEAKELELYKY